MRNISIINLDKEIINIHKNLIQITLMNLKKYILED